MKIRVLIGAMLLTMSFIAPAAAQVASHATSGAAVQPASTGKTQGSQAVILQPTDKPVAKVNGKVLTQRDLVREMYSIFPYARQHNGFPKAQEASIRAGALQMIIFEELVYQDAERRGLTIPPAKIDRAEKEFMGQFNSEQEFQSYLKVEMHGSLPQLRENIKRSLLIEKALKLDVENKSAVSLAEARAYYDKNPGKFEHPELFNFQAISIIPPRTASGSQNNEARKRAEAALKQAKAMKSYEDFGLLAEKISEDDYRVNMGDHKTVPGDKLPPQVLKVLQKMQVGQVSDLIQIENAYTIIRLNAHSAAGRTSFDTVKAQLQTDLQKAKYEQLRVSLDKKLRSNAKVEIVQG
ncbi:MAG TPA: peptidyl-prolyl cis-trans isomerase [Bryocella sp.]|nr:peptidyl-prolyl cis-trans isomerase [Bryocella sp.]